MGLQERQSRVTLQSIAGIAPPIYTLLLATLLLVALFFAILLLPSLIGNGSRVIIESSPPRAAVFIDREYMGHTPLTIFVLQGRRSIEVVRRGFAPHKEHLDIQGRLIGRLLFPRKVHRTVQLAPEVAPPLIAQEALQEFAQWALIGKSDESYPRPPILLDVAHDLLALESPQLIDALLLQSLPSLVDRAATTDWIAAAALRTGNELPLPSHQLGQMVAQIPALSAIGSRLPEYLRLLLTEDSALSESAWYRQQLPPAEPPRSQPTANELTVTGIQFARMPPGTFIMGGENRLIPHFLKPYLPHLHTIADSFYISRTEITRQQFAQFLDAQARWRPTNRRQLISEGVVDEYYLSDWGEQPPDQQPARYLSWYAAHAFCEWLQSLLPASLEGSQLRLPREDEWEYAAWLVQADSYRGVFQDFYNLEFRTPQRVSQSESHRYYPGNAGNEAPTPILYDMLGNVWEWMDNWYHPAQYIWGWEHPQPLGSIGAHKSVRGGSWINSRALVNRSTRAHQSPESSTAYLGFRVVLIPPLRE